MHFDGLTVKLPVSTVADEPHAQAVAATVASVADVAMIEVTSFETAATATQAVADAIVSAVNRARWAGRKEVENEAVAV